MFKKLHCRRIRHKKNGFFVLFLRRFGEQLRLEHSAA